MTHTPSAEHTLRAAACLCDIGREWVGGDAPLRTVLRRRQPRLHALDSGLRRDIESVLFAYARERAQVDAGLDTLISSWSPARRPGPQARWLARWYVLAAQRGLTWRADLDALLPVSLRRSLDTVTLAAGVADDLSAEIDAQLPAAERAGALQALQQRAPLVLRVRHLSVDEARRQLGRDGIEAVPHPLAPQAVVVDPPRPMQSHPLMRERRLQVQDASSQLACLALGVEPGQVVVDYCAGGGGKALALADAVTKKGRLLLLDRDRRRLDAALRRLKDVGHNAVHAHCGDGREAAPIEWRGQADRVLVDAPCSGLGRVRRQPELRWRYSPDEIQQFVTDQLALLRAASSLLKARGLLLYSTCSLRRAENEQVVQALLKQDTSLRPRSLDATLVSGLSEEDLYTHMLTLWPHRHACDGFFMALMQKKS